MKPRSPACELGSPLTVLGEPAPESWSSRSGLLPSSPSGLARLPSEHLALAAMLCCVLAYMLHAHHAPSTLPYRSLFFFPTVDNRRGSYAVVQ